MKTSIYLKEHNAENYEPNGSREYAALPRTEEFISVGNGNDKKYFQVTAVHYPENGEIEIYAIQAEPAWHYKKSKNIGFSFK
jgi:hypothetical protein